MDSQPDPFGQPDNAEANVSWFIDPADNKTRKELPMLGNIRSESPDSHIDHVEDPWSHQDQHPTAGLGLTGSRNVQIQNLPRSRLSGDPARAFLDRHLGHKQTAGVKRYHLDKAIGRSAPVPRDSGYDSPGGVDTYATSKGGIKGVSTTFASTKQHGHVRVKSTPGSSLQIELASEVVTPMMKQPESSPISPDQLATEVKGIYSGLVMVEAKCINIDAAQAAEPKSQLTKDQWQALIALHRTLLYEHHDFLMATQHPTATSALKGLAIKYSMPARMWKHGIHAFLEVLRHRRPESQEYMLAFIYLAYQMMALLFETVPVFTDTWIECLGDLARYRMAIEEDKEIHAAWGGVAARWYTMASDRNPSVGRLYHHLGILERPSLRKLCFYLKALTCTIPFTNARDSLATLCGPIVQDEKTIESSMQSPEARVVTFWALVCCSKSQDIIEKVGDDALRLLEEQPSRLRDFGTNLGITCIAGLFERGHPLNYLWRLYSEPSSQQQTQGPSQLKPTLEQCLLSTDSFYAQMNESLTFSASFYYKSFNMILHPWQDEAPKTDHLSFVHVNLVWQHSLHEMRVTKGDTGLLPEAFLSLIDPSRVNWVGMAAFFNSLSQYHAVSAFILAHGRAGTFPWIDGARPLPEDYNIRGLIWTQKYFPANHFPNQSEDDGRAIETETTRNARADRVLWLALYIAFKTGYMTYDEETRLFSAEDFDATPVRKTLVSVATEPVLAVPESLATASYLAPSELALSTRETTTMAQSMSCKRSSSSRSNSDEGFHVVKHPRTSVQYATRPAPRKPATTDTLEPP